MVVLRPGGLLYAWGERALAGARAGKSARIAMCPTRLSKTLGCFKFPAHHFLPFCAAEFFIRAQYIFALQPPPIPPLLVGYFLVIWCNVRSLGQYWSCPPLPTVGEMCAAFEPPRFSACGVTGVFEPCRSECRGPAKR